MPDLTRIAVFGGVYNNYLALEVALRDTKNRGVDGVFCLGDLGAFGPHPDRVFPLLRAYGVRCVRGNYDDSIGRGLADCQCGYTDPRDNHFAALSYRYTFANTSPENRAWLRDLPGETGTSRPGSGRMPQSSDGFRSGKRWRFLPLGRMNMPLL